MLSRAQALELILARCPLPEPETVPLLHSLGRFSSEPVHSAIDLPPFDNSAMDGFAARSADLGSPSPQSPASLHVIGKIAAGDRLDRPLQTGECVRIFTGSMLPLGADCVIMQEDTVLLDQSPGKIGVTCSCARWENVRFRGEDAQTGSLLLPVGARIHPGSLGWLAACGVQTVSVAKKPSVALLSTGNELFPAGSPLPPGKIYESNMSMLSALLQSIGIVPSLLPAVSDLGADLQDAMKNALASHDVLITTGGVSVGDFDLVKPSFERIGGTIDLWKVSLKPGKPFAFGFLGRKLLFGLPGNPVSAFVTFLLLCRPALLKMQGAETAEWELPSQRGELECDLENNGDRPHFLRVTINEHGNVSLAGVQASHILSGLGKTNGLLEMLPLSRLEKGATVTVLRLPGY